MKTQVRLCHRWGFWVRRCEFSEVDLVPGKWGGTVQDWPSLPAVEIGVEYCEEFDCMNDAERDHTLCLECQKKKAKREGRLFA